METLLFGLKAVHTIYVLLAALAAVVWWLATLNGNVKTEVKRRTKLEGSHEDTVKELSSHTIRINQIDSDIVAVKSNVSELFDTFTKLAEHMNTLTEANIEHSLFMKDTKSTQEKLAENLVALKEISIRRDAEFTAFKQSVAESNTRFDEFAREIKDFKEEVIRALSKT